MTRVSVALPDLGPVLTEAEEIVADNVTRAMRQATELLKNEVRDQVRRAGLGNKLANTIRGKTYPEGGRSLNPATYVYANAPRIIDAYARGATIVPVNGARFLAIPTRNVPRRGRGMRKAMTVFEVETSFNQDLILRRGKGGRLLGFVNVVQSKNRKGWRRGTERRLAQGRGVQLVHMFTFVPQVRVPKKLDLDGAAAAIGARVPGLIADNWR